MEPNWGDVRDRMLNLTMTQLKPAKALFSGCLAGASTKPEVVGAMVRQMRHWWRNCDWQGQNRVRHVLREIKKAEAA